MNLKFYGFNLFTAFPRVPGLLQLLVAGVHERGQSFTVVQGMSGAVRFDTKPTL